MDRHRTIFIFIFALVFLLVRDVYPAQKSLKVDVELVMVNVAVTDSDNRPVTELKAEAPMTLGIVFDISHSMERKLDFAKDAAMKFLEKGTPDDEYFLVEFSTSAKLAEGFTSDIRRLRDRLSLTPAQGATALYDAVYLGISKLKSGQHPKKALLLITDGEDNHSRYSRGDLREIVRESDAQIYVIDLGRALIGDLAEMTGGHLYRATVNDLEETCEKIALELKNQYVIGYESTNRDKDGKFRKLRVKVTPPPGMTRLNVRARNGYFAAK